MYLTKLVSPLPLIIMVFSLYAQTTDSLTKKKQVRLIPLPVIYYSPETRIGFGALVAGSFNSAYDELTTASYAQTYFLYTVNKQYDWGTQIRYYAPQNTFIFQGRFSYTFFPEFYFGTETEQPELNKDTISYNRLAGDFRFYWRVKKSFYLGASIRYNKIYNINSPADGAFLINKPLGYTGYEIIGIAPGITYETRDSQTFPRSGSFIEFSLTPFPAWKTSMPSFINIRLDARKYYPLQLISKRDVLALQLVANLNSGEVPFKDMADIGGGNVMRGYYTGFYRYKNLYAFQVEYRAGLWKFIGANLWIGGALTPTSMFSLGDSSIKPNAGIGLRVMINQKDKVNVRVDQGFGKQKQQGLYLDIAEAF